MLVVPRDYPLLEVDALGDAVWRTMAAVDVADPLDILPQPSERVIQLARLIRRHIWILIAADRQQRCLTPVRRKIAECSI